MSVERTTEVVYPNVFPQCANCGFARRAMEVGQERFPQAKLINLQCEPSGGGSITQVKTGEFKEFQSRTLTATPDTVDKDKICEHLEERVFICPAEVLDSSQESPKYPYFEQVGSDIFRRGFRYIVPTVFPK